MQTSLSVQAVAKLLELSLRAILFQIECAAKCIIEKSATLFHADPAPLVAVVQLMTRTAALLKITKRENMKK